VTFADVEYLKRTPEEISRQNSKNARMVKSPIAVSSKSTAAKILIEPKSRGSSSTVVHNSPGAISARPAPVEEYFLQNASPEEKRRYEQIVRAELWQLSV